LGTVVTAITSAAKTMILWDKRYAAKCRGYWPRCDPDDNKMRSRGLV